MDEDTKYLSVPLLFSLLVMTLILMYVGLISVDPVSKGLVVYLMSLITITIYCILEKVTEDDDDEGHQA